MNKAVKAANFLCSVAMQCQMPVIIHHASMVPIHIFMDDPAGVTHQVSYVCHPNHLEQVVKSLRRLTPVALPKVNGRIREEGTTLKDPGMVRVSAPTATQETAAEIPPLEAVGAYMAEQENKILRELLALRHGCPGMLYLDDGEMQCGECGIDFRQDPIEKIVTVFERHAQARMKSAFPPEDKPTPICDKLNDALLLAPGPAFQARDAWQRLAYAFESGQVAKYLLDKLEENHAARTGISMDQAPGDGGGEEPGAAVEVGAGVLG